MGTSVGKSRLFIAMAGWLMVCVLQVPNRTQSEAEIMVWGMPSYGYN